ncbi:Xaa-Pro dipeptidase [Nocardiopsis sp. Huas11]|uniref:M24 family metallopeptidase n=1 Tax=Nocardiopsis sp. Huas11 TaxID=2183912 RepID=UPI000EABE949|nr:Xaa-Pro peptidase family protein [Nocardiopsis sp. Huas11]RKS09796.1 Xaa-Pro dipeptidase [Nocardiopsis sp. Huas11]
MIPTQEYELRRARVRESMEGMGLSAAIITAPEDVYYLSGLNNQGHFVFTALVLDTRSPAATLVAREMEAPTAAVQAPGCAFAAYADGEDPGRVLCDLVRPLIDGERRVGHQPESLSLPVAVWRDTDRRLGSPRWVDCAQALTEVQAVRTDREIACLREAGRLADIGLRAGLAAAAGRRRGGEIVGEILAAMLSAGSGYPGFVPLVRAVRQIGQEHVAWTGDPLTAQDPLFFELSASIARYHAPLGRTARPHGVEGAGAAADIAHAGLDAITAGLRPGRTAQDVYGDWKATIEAGLGRGYQRHHCGYSVGLGFPPSWMAGRVDGLRPGNDTPLRAGMTFHVQSWVDDPRAGTYAISDTALVTDGGGELLTGSPRAPERPG